MRAKPRFLADSHGDPSATHRRDRVDGCSRLNSDTGKNEGRPPHGGMEDKVYADYQGQRSRLLDSERDLGSSFDKYLLMLSGGALGLSLTFVGDVVTPGKVVWSWVILVGWGLLVFTVVAVLLCIRLSLDGHEKFRDILDEESGKGGKDFWKRVRERQREFPQAHWVGALNWVGLATFAVGVACLLIFTLLNLSAAEG